MIPLVDHTQPDINQRGPAPYIEMKV
jgi:hypothetical protein